MAVVQHTSTNVSMHLLPLFWWLVEVVRILGESWQLILYMVLCHDPIASLMVDRMNSRGVRSIVKQAGFIIRAS